MCLTGGHRSALSTRPDSQGSDEVEDVWNPHRTPRGGLWLRFRGSAPRGDGASYGRAHGSPPGAGEKAYSGRGAGATLCPVPLSAPQTAATSHPPTGESPACP